MGLVNGLAWTPVGGDTLQIEVIVVDGTGKIEITGQLGDVMKESVKAGISYIRSQAKVLEIESDFYSKKTSISMYLRVLYRKMAHQLGSQSQRR